MAAAEDTGSLDPPKHILNAPTRWMKAEGFGAGYRYDHDTEAGFSGQDYFPPGMARPRFYEPTDRGAERDLQKRALYLEEERARLSQSGSE
jgi:putative ATPase